MSNGIMQTQRVQSAPTSFGPRTMQQQYLESSQIKLKANSKGIILKIQMNIGLRF